MSFYTMGVLNITPNSFSDGGQFNSPQAFEQKFDDIVSWADVIDIGAESTAPFNTKVSEKEELKRFQDIFIPFLESRQDPEKMISIDTYKIDVFNSLYQSLKRNWPKCQVIFNDVSGKLDSDLLAYLVDNTDIIYVFSHSLALTRAQTGQHMDYCLDIKRETFLSEFVNYFKEGLRNFKDRGNVWIDPCFGFSKTRDQNHLLLRNLSELLTQIPTSIPLVYGISRKSFLRFSTQVDKINISELEQMQAILIYDFLKNQDKRTCYFRVHDPSSIQAVRNVKKIIEKA